MAEPKKFNASVSSFDSRVDLAEHILSNMSTQSNNLGQVGMLLAGDPGVGKTSFIEFFAKLCGLSLITVEAPHITEEHIINIPFIVVKAGASGEHKVATGGEVDADYKIVMSDSNLYTAINQEKKLPDADYLKSIYKSSDKTLIKIFEELGGDEKTVPKLVDEVRGKYEMILFLDEYFRQTSTRIRNMLRTILNGKIGNHKLPKTTYVVYASNIHDEGVEGMPRNNEFFTTTMKHPPKDEWFAWLVNKYEKDEKHQLKDEVVQEFYKLLKDEDINLKDIEADVRVSPRRWEQLLTYINAALPVKNEEDAKNLLTNVKLNFKNYMTGEHAKLVDTVLDTTVKLIEQTSKIKMPAHVHGASSWRKTLQHQIETKMKLGNIRKYIPIISGLPGVGKTTQIYELGKDLNLAVVVVDVSLLSAEDVTGIPIPKTKESGEIETKFSMPKLFQYIKTEMNEAERDHIEALKKSGDTKDIEEYKKKEWKYLLFFDELNRNNANVFNGIRRLLLERNLGKGLELPKGTVIVAAINPDDIGAEKLTQHMIDVSDVVDTAPDWNDTKKIIQSKKIKVDHPETEKFVYEMLLAFVDHFHQKKGDAPKGADREYFLNIGGSQVLYVSPREYTNLYVNAVKYLDQKIGRIIRKRSEGGKPTAEQLRKDVTDLKHALYTKFEQLLNTIFLKHDVEAPEFLHGLEQWFQQEATVDVESMFFSKKASTKPFKDIMGKYMESGGGHLGEDIDFINYVNNSDPQTLKDDMQTFIEKEITDITHVTQKSHKKKVIKGDAIETLGEEVTKFEHLARELTNAFRLHDFSHEKIEILEGVVKDFLKKINKLSKNSDDMIAILGTSGAVKHLTQGLRP